jgi:hypothetical protein
MGLRLNVRDDDTGIALPMVLGAVALILEIGRAHV